jgi:hypothetical protein
MRMVRAAALILLLPACATTLEQRFTASPSAAASEVYTCVLAEVKAQNFRTLRTDEHDLFVIADRSEKGVVSATVNESRRGDQLDIRIEPSAGGDRLEVRALGFQEVVSQAGFTRESRKPSPEALAAAKAITDKCGR